MPDTARALAGSPTARGSTVLATLNYLRATWGDDMLEAILATLGERGAALRRARTTDFLPYEEVHALWESADARLAQREPHWMEHAGMFSIESLGQELYGGLLRKATPAEFITQAIQPFRLYYSPGTIIPVELEAGRAVLRLVGFDAKGPLFCRRQIGGLRVALRLAGGHNVRVRHVRCVFEDDACCEWEVRWT